MGGGGSSANRELACPYCNTRFLFEKGPDALPTNEKVLKVVEMLASANMQPDLAKQLKSQYYQLGVSPEDD